MCIVCELCVCGKKMCNIFFCIECAMWVGYDSYGRYHTWWCYDDDDDTVYDKNWQCDDDDDDHNGAAMIYI